MLEQGFQPYASCDTCQAYKPIDLAALIAKVGPSFTLWNKRCKCRMTEGCEGRNKFFTGPGPWHVKCYDPSTDEWWQQQDRARERRKYELAKAARTD